MILKRNAEIQCRNYIRIKSTQGTGEDCRYRSFRWSVFLSYPSNVPCALWEICGFWQTNESRRLQLSLTYHVTGKADPICYITLGKSIGVCMSDIKLLPTERFFNALLLVWRFQQVKRLFKINLRQGWKCPQCVTLLQFWFFYHFYVLNFWMLPKKYTEGV